MIELTMELCDHTKKISGSDTMVLDDQKRHPGKKSEHNSLYSGKCKFLRKSTMGDYRFFINWLQKGRLNSKPGEQNNIPV